MFFDFYSPALNFSIATIALAGIVRRKPGIITATAFSLMYALCLWRYTARTLYEILGGGGEPVSYFKNVEKTRRQANYWTVG